MDYSVKRRRQKLTAKMIRVIEKFDKSLTIDEVLEYDRDQYFDLRGRIRMYLILKQK